MSKQITRKLDFEKAKLRDKAQNPDYRERFQDERGHFDRGGTHGNRITVSGVNNLSLAFSKILATDKETSWRVFEGKIRTTLLKIALDDSAYFFSFKHKPAAFAKANTIDVATATIVLPRVRARAQELLRMTKGRYAKAGLWDQQEIDPKTRKLRLQRYITFKTFLIPVEPQPWHSFFKRLRLDPVEHDQTP